MKKKLGALFAALVLGGAVFAENYTKGIDIQFGIPISATKMKSEGNWESLSAELAQKIFEVGGQFKVATYDCFLLNDMLGIYASVGVNLGFFGTDTEATVSVGGKSYTVSGSEISERTEGMISSMDAVGFMTSLEFMVGPAFGVNLGGVRFQTGLAFHAVFGWGFSYEDSDPYDYSENTKVKVRYNALGLALTPQFRFGASKRCSFVLGCDLVFDFPKKLTYEKGHFENKINFTREFDKGFRFGATPYIGLGINF